MCTLSTPTTAGSSTSTASYAPHDTNPAAARYGALLRRCPPAFCVRTLVPSANRSASASRILLCAQVTAKSRKSDGLTWVQFDDGVRQYTLAESEYNDKWMLVKQKPEMHDTHAALRLKPCAAPLEPRRSKPRRTARSRAAP